MMTSKSFYKEYQYIRKIVMLKYRMRSKLYNNCYVVN